MPSIDRTVAYDASPEAVWAVVTDFAKWPEWLTILREWTAEPPTELVVGAPLQGAITVMGIPMAVTWSVDAVDVNRFVQVSGTAVLNSKVTLAATIAPNDDGTSLELEIQIDNQMLVGPLADTLMNAVQKDVDASMANFRDRL
jgi:acetyl-CoA C-acetyltransferase